MRIKSQLLSVVIWALFFLNKKFSSQKEPHWGLPGKISEQPFRTKALGVRREVLLLRRGDLAGEEQGVSAFVHQDGDEGAIDEHLPRIAHALESHADGGDSSSFATVFVELGVGLVLDGADHQVFIGHAGEVGTRQAGRFHAEGAERVFEIDVIVELETRQGEVDFAFVGGGLDGRQHRGVQAVDEGIDLDVGVGQQNVELNALVLTERQGHGRVVLAPHVAHVAIAEHHVRIFGASFTSKGAGGGQVLVELGRPGSLEVDGIEQIHDHVGRDLLDDGWNLAVGVALGPAVHVINGLGVEEVGGIDLGVVAGSSPVEEIGLEFDVLLRPDGVGHLEHDADVGVSDTSDDGSKTGVDGFHALRFGVAQGSLHGRESGFLGTVEGHRQGDGNRCRRHENVLAGGGSCFLLQERQTEANGDVGLRSGGRCGCVHEFSSRVDWVISSKRNRTASRTNQPKSSQSNVHREHTT